MRKIVSMSALVSGLLASPLLASVPVGRGGAVDAAEAMAMHLDAVTGGAPLEAEQMAALQRQMAERARARIEQALAARGAGKGNLFFVDGPAPMVSGRSDTPGLMPAVVGEGGQATEKAAFLGIVTSPANAVLREQLKLQRGIGLLVDFVVKESPAADAGVRPHDILEKIDDQWLVNGEQFSVLVRGRKPGDSVVLTIIRGGERMPVTVKVGEREMPLLEEQEAFRFGAPPGMVAMPVDGGNGWQRGVRKSIVHAPDGTVTRTLVDGENTFTMTVSAEGKSQLVIKDKAEIERFHGGYMTEEEKAAVPAEYAAAVKELLANSPHGRARGIDGGDAGVKPVEPLHGTRQDQDQRITLTVTGQDRSVVVTDVKTGQVVYDGPVNGEEEWKKLPAGVAEKVKDLEAKMGIGK